MLPLYIGALTLGGLLIAFSIVFGGDSDKDLDKDLELELDGDHDHDHDHDLDKDLDLGKDLDAHAADRAVGGDGVGGIWIPLLSMRFWTFALASFGLSGTLLTLLQVPALIAAVTSVALGGSLGWLVAWIFHTLKQTSVTGQTGTAHLQGTEASVLLSIAPNKPGKIRLLVDGQYLDLPARTRDDAAIDRSSKVLVVSVENGVAEVTRLLDLGGAAEGAPTRAKAPSKPPTLDR